MKKFLQQSYHWLVLLIAWFAVSVSAMAQDATSAITADWGYATKTVGEVQIYSNCSGYSYGGSDYGLNPCNGYGSITFTAPSGKKFSKITLNNLYKFSGEYSNMLSTPEGCTYNAALGCYVWEGSASEVQFYITSGIDISIKGFSAWFESEGGSGSGTGTGGGNTNPTVVPDGTAVTTLVDGMQYTLAAVSYYYNYKRFWNVNAAGNDIELSSGSEGTRYTCEAHGDKVALKAPNGKYLRIKQANDVTWMTDYSLTGLDDSYSEICDLTVEPYSGYQNGIGLKGTRGIQNGAPYVGYLCVGYSNYGQSDWGFSGNNSLGWASTYSTIFEARQYTPPTETTYTVTFSGDVPEGCSATLGTQTFTAEGTYSSYDKLGKDDLQVSTTEDYYYDVTYDEAEATYTVTFTEYRHYTVSVTGCDEEGAGVRYRYDTYYAGDKINSKEPLTEDDLYVIPVNGYKDGTVSVGDETVYVTYTAADSNNYTVVIEGMPEAASVKIGDETFSADGTYEFSSNKTYRGYSVEIDCPETHYTNDSYDCYDEETGTFTITFSQYYAYSVAVAGASAYSGSEAGVKTNGSTYHADDTIYSRNELTAADAQALYVDGYTGTVDFAGTTFTVSYTKNDYITFDAASVAGYGNYNVTKEGVTLTGWDGGDYFIAYDQNNSHFVINSPEVPVAKVVIDYYWGLPADGYDAIDGCSKGSMNEAYTEWTGSANYLELWNSNAYGAKPRSIKVYLAKATPYTISIEGMPESKEAGIIVNGDYYNGVYDQNGQYTYNSYNELTASSIQTFSPESHKVSTTFDAENKHFDVVYTALTQYQVVADQANQYTGTANVVKVNVGNDYKWAPIGGSFYYDGTLTEEAISLVEVDGFTGTFTLDLTSETITVKYEQAAAKTYTVVFAGKEIPEGAALTVDGNTVSYTGTTHSFESPFTYTAEQAQAAEVDGYTATVEYSEGTFTVTYTKVYAVTFDFTSTEGRSTIMIGEWGDLNTYDGSECKESQKYNKDGISLYAQNDTGSFKSQKSSNRFYLNGDDNLVVEANEEWLIKGVELISASSSFPNLMYASSALIDYGTQSDGLYHGTWPKEGSATQSVKSIAFPNNYATYLGKIIVTLEPDPTYVPKQYVDYTEVYPAPTASVESLKNISFTFDGETLVLPSAIETVTINGVEKAATVIAKSDILNIELAEAITTDGPYTLTLPKETFTTQTGKYNSAIELTFNVVNPYFEVTYAMLDPNPAENVVLTGTEFFNRFVVKTNLTLSAEATNGEKDIYLNKRAAKATLEVLYGDQSVAFNVDGQTAHGTYSYSIPEGTIVAANGKKNARFDVTYTISGPTAPEYTGVIPTTDNKLEETVKGNYQIAFSKDLTDEFNFAKATIELPDGETHLTFSDWERAVTYSKTSDRVVTFSVGEYLEMLYPAAFEHDGTFTFAFPYGAFTSTDGAKSEEFSISYNYVAPVYNTYSVVIEGIEDTANLLVTYGEQKVGAGQDIKVKKVQLADGDVTADDVTGYTKTIAITQPADGKCGVVLVTYTAIPQIAFTADPAAGEVSLDDYENGITSVDIEFEDVTIDYFYWSGEQIPAGFELKDADGNPLNTQIQSIWPAGNTIKIFFTNAIATPGEYTFTIPAGVFFNTDEQISAGDDITWTLTAPTTFRLSDYALIGVRKNPDSMHDETVKSLTGVTINAPEGMTFAKTPTLQLEKGVLNEETQEYDYTTVDVTSALNTEGNVLTLTFDEPIAEKGSYQFRLAAGSLSAGELTSKEYTFSASVDPNFDIQLSGLSSTMEEQIAGFAITFTKTDGVTYTCGETIKVNGSDVVVNTTETPNGVQVTFPEAYTDYTNYNIVVPAGFITASNGEKNNEKDQRVQLVYSITKFLVSGSTPANGAELTGALEKITLTFDESGNYFVLQPFDVTVSGPNGTSTVSASVTDEDWYSNSGQVVLTLSEPISAAGDYSINIPEGVILNDWQAENATKHNEQYGFKFVVPEPPTLEFAGIRAGSETAELLTESGAKVQQVGVLYVEFAENVNYIDGADKNGITVTDSEGNLCALYMDGDVPYTYTTGNKIWLWVNPAMTEVDTYTIHIPAGVVKGAESGYLNGKIEFDLVTVGSFDLADGTFEPTGTVNAETLQSFTWTAPEGKTIQSVDLTLIGTTELNTDTWLWEFTALEGLTYEIAGEKNQVVFTLSEPLTVPEGQLTAGLSLKFLNAAITCADGSLSKEGNYSVTIDPFPNDINRDGKEDTVKDAIAISDIILRMDRWYENNTNKADVNGDGEVTIGDLVKYIQQLQPAE